MKIQRLLPACVASLTLVASLLSLSANAQRKPRVAVLDFDYGTVANSSTLWFGNTNVDIGKGITDMLVTDLVKDGTYSVIERSAIDKILTEQNFSNSDRANASSAAKIGKLLGVDAIIVGSVTQFGNETKNQNIGGGGYGWHGIGAGGFGHSKSNANVGITARIVNIDTGEILAVAEGAGTSSRSGTSLNGSGSSWLGHGGNGNVDFGSSNFQETIIGEATKAAVAQLSTNVVSDAPKVAVRSVTIEGVVASADGGQIVLNVGSSAGLKVGDQLQVLRVTKEIKDPTTGNVLRRLTDTIGVVKATDVDAGSALCTVVSGSGFKTGDLVKTVTQ